MAEILDAAIIDFSGSVDAVIEYDWEGNMYGKDEDGVLETVTSFYVGETIDLIMQLPEGYKPASVVTSTGHTISQDQIAGPVPRTVEVEDMLFESAEGKSLSWRPGSAFDIINDHLADGTVTLAYKDNKITSTKFPVVLDFNYSISVYTFSTIHPAGLTLEEDETFPQALVVEVEKL